MADGIDVLYQLEMIIIENVADAVFHFEKWIEKKFVVGPSS